MKIPKKCWPIGIAFVLAGFMAVTTALAAGPPGAGPSGAGPPGAGAAVAAKAVAALPGYMVLASNVDNPTIMNCIRTQVRGPGDKNLVSDFQAALSCW